MFYPANDNKPLFVTVLHKKHPKSFVSNFWGAVHSNTVATLLLDFARRHMPEELANIEREYNGVYEKRHQRIEEKKAVLLVQERARERKVTQTEEEPQTEEIAA